MTRPQTPTSDAPRWPTLAALGAAVLGLHLVLLVGGLPVFASSAAPAPGREPATTVQTRTLAPTPHGLPAVATKSASSEKASPPDRASATAARAPASARLSYDVAGSAKGLNYSAKATLNWTTTGARYDARMEMRLLLLGSRVQTSTGRIGSGGLLPERFSDKSRSERAAHFDHDQRRIRFSANTPEAALQPGAQDRLSLFLQLAALLNARPEAFEAGQSIGLQVAGTRDADIWRFQVGEEETLTLPAGALRARLLVREPRKTHDSRIEIWLAPSLEHLPVRIRITQQNGDLVDQRLSQIP